MKKVLSNKKLDITKKLLVDYSRYFNKQNSVHLWINCNYVNKNGIMLPICYIHMDGKLSDVVESLDFEIGLDVICKLYPYETLYDRQFPLVKNIKRYIQKLISTPSFCDTYRDIKFTSEHPLIRNEEDGVVVVFNNNELSFYPANSKKYVPIIFTRKSLRTLFKRFYENIITLSPSNSGNSFKSIERKTSSKNVTATNQIKNVSNSIIKFIIEHKAKSIKEESELIKSLKVIGNEITTVISIIESNSTHNSIKPCSDENVNDLSNSKFKLINIDQTNNLISFIFCNRVYIKSQVGRNIYASITFDIDQHLRFRNAIELAFSKLPTICIPNSTEVSTLFYHALKESGTLAEISGLFLFNFNLFEFLRETSKILEKISIEKSLK